MDWLSKAIQTVAFAARGILALLAIPQFFDSVDTVRAVHDYLDADRVP